LLNVHSTNEMQKVSCQAFVEVDDERRSDLDRRRPIAQSTSLHRVVSSFFPKALSAVGRLMRGSVCIRLGGRRPAKPGANGAGPPAKSRVQKQTFFRGDHRLQLPSAELSGGELVTPFERSSRIEYILARLKAGDLPAAKEPGPTYHGPVRRLLDAGYLGFLASA
jgi:hypothetical protein